MSVENAAALLRTYGAPSLLQMARQRQLETKEKTKDALVGLLAPRLYDHAWVKKALADLEPVERAVLDRLILLGGTAPTEMLRQQLADEGKVTVAEKKTQWGGTYQERTGSPWNRGSTKFEDVIARLGVLGLAFTGNPVAGGNIVELQTPGNRLLIVPAVLNQLPKVTLAVETTSPPPNLSPAGSAATLRDVYTLLSTAAEEAIPLTNRGLIVKRALVRISEMLRLPEDADLVRSEDELARLPLLRALAEDLDLLVTRPGALVFGEGAEGFLGRPSAERLLALVEAYAATDRWCELFRITGVSVGGKGASARQAPSSVIAARQRVIAELRDLPSEQWVSLNHLVDRLRRRASEFLFSRNWAISSYASYIYSESVYHGANALGLTFDGVPSDQSGWNTVEGGFIGVVVEVLHWLGVVDVGDGGGESATFRITADGARLLRGERPRAEPSPPNVVIQPNFQIFALEPTGEDVLFRLDRLAERIRAEQVVEYRLTRESVYRAQRKGFETEEAIRFLEQVSRVPLPQNVRRTLEEWGALHNRIVVRRGACVVQAVDAATLDAIYAHPRLGVLLGRRLAPTLALVPTAKLTEVDRRLLESDVLPALSEGASAEDGSRFFVDSEGRIAFRESVPSAFVLGAIRPFVEDGNESIRLTVESLRRAATMEMSIDDIVTTLERFHAGPVSADVVALIRRWGKNWGQGALLDVVLLQVEDPAVLASLLEDPDLRPRLRPLPGAPAFAIVSREAIKLVRAALSARGMGLTDHLIE